MLGKWRRPPPSSLLNICSLKSQIEVFWDKQDLFHIYGIDIIWELSLITCLDWEEATPPWPDDATRDWIPTLLRPLSLDSTTENFRRLTPQEVPSSVLPDEPRCHYLLPNLQLHRPIAIHPAHPGVRGMWIPVSGSGHDWNFSRQRRPTSALRTSTPTTRTMNLHLIPFGVYTLCVISQI